MNQEMQEEIKKVATNMKVKRLNKIIDSLRSINTDIMKSFRINRKIISFMTNEILKIVEDDNYILNATKSIDLKKFFTDEITDL